MDTSNRLDTVLGRHAVSCYQLVNEERLELLKTVLSEFKPYMQYLNGFKTADELIRERVACVTGGELDPRVSRFRNLPRQGQQRCLWIGHLEYNPSAEHLSIGTQWYPKVSRSIEMHLSPEATFLVWEYSHTAYRDGPENNPRIRQVFSTCEFRVPDDAELVERFSPKRLYSFVQYLNDKMDQVVTERRHRLEQAERLLSFVSGIRSRMTR